eukprot:TRINITY_DN3998_c0_g1_i1.p1 TRINITY_DN3998_c0_g1~~TRINITY_DN3998_c0_g1_i1.p1  ORF type:complete len:214 (-),score=38.85 TRINITY_DN3998_c0_g1_i1:115-756(-)
MLKLILVSLLFSVCFAATICPQLDAGGFSQPCISEDEKLPYCRTHPISQTDVEYICVECATDCDCKQGQYCSNSLQDFGVCKKFEKEGDDCLPYVNSVILNTTYSEELKCADLYVDINGNTQADYTGTCIERKCRFCSSPASPSGFSGQTQCGGSAGGVKASRVCVWPGREVSTVDAFWTAPIYRTDRVAVWLALIFVLIVVLLAVVAFSRLS